MCPLPNAPRQVWYKRAMPELSPQYYPNAQDLGMPPYMQQRLAGILMSDVDLPPATRANRTRYNDWSPQDFLAYGHWVVDVAQYTGKDSPVSFDVVISNASKLDLGPSLGSLIRRGINSADILESKGIVTREHYNDMTNMQMVIMGRDIADTHNKRLSVPMIKEMHTRGEFPSVEQLNYRFGSLGAFQELIGRPHSHTWVKQDFIEWGAELIRQNKGMHVNENVINHFRREGKGPGSKAIWRKLGSMNEFRERSVELYNKRLAAERIVVEATQNAYNLDPRFTAVITNNPTDPTELAKRYGYYRIAKQLIKATTPWDLTRIVQAVDDFDFMQALHMQDSTITNKTIAVTAQRLQVYWSSGYRFAQVDLVYSK